ncbi:uncharacterized protein LOC113204829 [Frankliniella occidentalis]|uniref:Uncharacterized protein LOC113204829 n=1 Tax=Frankliniella occidentalis TaxID=133901 RepID=A0A9C6X179_FRAOC|nr:uncharacterized protein LOC113204829 [Frankliniella occidentalis]
MASASKPENGIRTRSESESLGRGESDGEVASILTKWGFERLCNLFEDNKIDLEVFTVLDETTARSFLRPGDFVKFWKVFEARKGELQACDPPPTKKPCLDPVTTIPVPVGEPSTSRSKPDSASYFTLSDDEEADVASHHPLTDTAIDEIRQLFNSFEGQVLLSTSELTDSDRDSIAQIVICNELRKNKPNGHIKRARLIQLSRIITSIFKDESKEIYYVPYTKVNLVVYAAKGKLISQYYSWRKKGVAAKVLNDIRTVKWNPASPDSLMTADVELSVKWLKVNLGPQSVVEAHWDKTFAHRISLLDIKRKDKISIAEYYSSFPVLRQPWGYSLLLQDYNKLFDGTQNNFASNWKGFALKLTEKLKKIKGLLVDHLDSFIQQEQEVNVCHHFLMLFAHLFPPQVVVRGRKPNNWTATKAEMQQGFLLHVKTEEELHVFIANKLKRLRSFKKVLQFQPFPVIVGKDLRSVEQSLVVVEPTQFYVVESPSAAVDICFKIYQSLVVDYPSESKGMWRVIQQCVFHVTTEFDEVIPSLIPLLKYFTSTV